MSYGYVSGAALAGQRAMAGPPRVVDWARWAAFAFCVALFAYGLAKADLEAGIRRIVAIGPLVVVVLLPFPLAMACDAAAWRALVRGLGQRADWRSLYKVRLALEAVTNSTPAGAVWAEAVSPILVQRRTGARVADVVAASTAKRWIIVRMHGAYVAFTVAFGYASLSRAADASGVGQVIVIALLAGALGLVLFSMAFESLAAHGKIAGRVSAFLGRRRLARVKSWIEQRSHHFIHADTQINRLSNDVPTTRRATSWLVGLWLFEGLETFLILRLLGAPFGLLEVMSFDAALSVLRSAAVFAPAGIGVQDVGYLAALEAYGIPPESGIAPAFVVIKRLKEAIWVAIGFVLLARTGATRRFFHRHPPSQI